MKHITVSFLLLTVIALNSISAQPTFEGRLTYVQKTSGGMASESKFVEYYKGDNVVSDMPDIKSKIILTVFTYDDDDFDEETNAYRGNSKYSIVISDLNKTYE